MWISIFPMNIFQAKKCHGILPLRPPVLSAKKWPIRINTRTGGGGQILPPHLFFANNLKTAARSLAKFGIPAHNSRTHLLCKF